MDVCVLEGMGKGKERMRKGGRREGTVREGEGKGSKGANGTRAGDDVGGLA